MNIAIIICIPITAIVVGFLTLKSVQLGLKWQVQVSNKEQPELKPLQPIVTAIDNKKAEKINNYTQEQIKEYFFGGE